MTGVSAGQESEMPTFPLVPADYSRRAGAYILDVLFVVIPPIAALFIAIFLVVVGVPLSLWTLLLVVGVGWLLVAGLWNDVIRQGTTGATFGKSRQSLALVRSTTGESVGVGLAALRVLTFWIFNALTGGLFLVVDLLTPAFNERNQRLLDMLLNTLVVDTRRIPAPPPTDPLGQFEVGGASDDPFA